MLNQLANFDFGVFYIISQLFEITGATLSLYAMQRKKKTQILNYTVLAATCGIFHYLFLGAWSGVATKIVSASRNTVAAYEAHKHRVSKSWPIIFVALYIIGGIFTYSSPLSILPVAATSIYTIAIYIGNESVIRKTALFTSALWLIYNICVFSIFGIIMQVIFIINDLLAILRYKKAR